MFLKILKFQNKTPLLVSFPVNFSKFLRAHFFGGTRLVDASIYWRPASNFFIKQTPSVLFLR